MGERVRKVHGHPGRGGEEASTKPRAKGKTKAAGPSGGRRKREDEESRSRRIMTETYKSQSCVKDFIDCHLIDWLSDGCDKVYLPRDIFSGESRAKILSAVAFCTGWLPTDPKVSDGKAAVLEAAHSAYCRRNKPVETTGWTPGDIHKFMTWQLDQYQRGRVRKSEVGGFAWKLPKRGEGGEPAPLPAAVVDFLKSKKKGRAEESEQEDEEEDDSPFSLEKDGVNFFLVENDTNRRVALPALKKKGVAYSLYSADGEWAVAGGNPGDDDPEYCSDIFEKAFPKDKTLMKRKKVDTEPEKPEKPGKQAKVAPSNAGKDKVKGGGSDAASGKAKTASHQQQSSFATKPLLMAGMKMIQGLVPKGTRIERGTVSAPSTAAPSSSVVAEKPDEAPESEDEIGSLFSGTPSEPEQKEEGAPRLEVLADASTVLRSPQDGKELILPEDKDFQIVKDDNGTWILECTSHPEVKRRTVSKALESKRATLWQEPPLEDEENEDQKEGGGKDAAGAVAAYVPQTRKRQKQAETPERERKVLLAKEKALPKRKADAAVLAAAKAREQKLLDSMISDEVEVEEPGESREDEEEEVPKAADAEDGEEEEEQHQHEETDTHNNNVAEAGE
ncbi:Uncharacterized protein SCF082_LOCUS2181 [Durusdinium trenchii]|uniref:Uncharacterized protein n=1 Tax=Durusdinium trenchii TaxID=1381693 RepID=A0ABP0HJQ2_9DINO